jgi:hypothetical protein
VTGNTSRAPLTVRLVLREALATGRGRFWAVIVPALLIFVPLTLIDTYAEYLAARREGDGSPLGLLVEGFSLAGASGLLFGWVVFAGLLDAVVGAQHFGRPDFTLAERLRRLPLGRLIAANLLVGFVVILGASLLIVPGLVALTLLGIVGPLIVGEGYGVLGALRRSVVLVRSHLWVAFVAIALPFLVEQAIEDGMLTIWPSDLWAGALVSIALTLVVGVTVALIEVVLAYELMTRFPDDAPAGYAARPDGRPPRRRDLRALPPVLRAAARRHGGRQALRRRDRRPPHRAADGRDGGHAHRRRH